MENNYSSPKKLDELSRALEQKNDNTYIIAGGTDLCIEFIKNQIYDFKIIDISKIKKLKNITEANEDIVIGACVTMTQLENNEVISKYVPALSIAAYNLGSTQIRNSATIGGNLANASQCGDTIPVLFAYDANIEILNSRNEYRYEKVRDFVTGIGKTTLNKDEVITNIIIKKSNYISSFAKVGSRKTVTISKINCCGKFKLDDTNVINEAEIYMGAVGIKPIKATIIENELLGKNLGSIGINLEKAIQMQIENAIPERSSKHYKQIAAIGVIEDMLNSLRR